MPVALALLLAPVLYEDPSALHLSNELSSELPNDLPNDLLDELTVEPVAAEVSPNAVAIEGGKWSEELHLAVSPDCHHNITTEPFAGQVRTGFVSFPRSGNSYVRSLVERATGYQTSSICALRCSLQSGSGTNTDSRSRL